MWHDALFTYTRRPFKRAWSLGGLKEVAEHLQHLRRVLAAPGGALASVVGVSVRDLTSLYPSIPQGDLVDC